MDRLGILPAAGVSERFHGLMKEFLPVKDGVRVMDFSMRAVTAVCSRVLIVSNHQKIQQHIAYIPESPHVFYSIQRDKLGLWGAVVKSFAMAADKNFFAMPDTIIPIDCFKGKEFRKDFYLGLFETELPQRFGVLQSGKIVDKDDSLSGKHQAWGVLVWSRRVVQHWIKNFKEIENFTQAINMAMDHFGYETFDLAAYADMASFDDYMEVLRHV